MVKIRQNLLPESLYSWKSPYSMTPTRIVVHNTANDASAENEIKYMHRDKSNGVQTSFHYAVDDIEAVQGLPENRNGWHAGDGSKGKGNREGIGIEICYSKSGGDKFIKAEQNAVELIVDILKRYGWGIDKVTKHQDYAKKYCPHRTLDMGWNRFLDMIRTKLNENTEIIAPKKVIGIVADIQRGYNAKWGGFLGTIEVDNIAGNDTKKHLIKALQYEMNLQYGCKLDVDGSFGPKTKAQFLSLKQGVKGNITWLCQARLYIKGYNPNGLDHIYGSGMKACVKQYQKDKKLEVDGILGKNTAYSLFN
ncbi:MAG: N-acetylmuramoyl-L-alanine amidase [Bacilli bacterium]|nr:N-acetylmuramoyl-L-alanine amidase [Bacilli bacterium]